METDRTFQGSIPALYDQYFGPMIFAPYANDLAARLADLRQGQVLETAAGTGVVTRALVSALPEEIAIVATDLNQPMLNHAADRLPSARVSWRQADAQALPIATKTHSSGGMPVRRDVLPRQAPRIRRGVARAQAGWALPVQRLGPDRGEEFADA